MGWTNIGQTRRGEREREGGGGEREREGEEREREREREKEKGEGREREGGRDRWTDRLTETDGQTGRQTHW